MATHDLAELTSTLQTLSLDAAIPQYDGADILNNPLDLCRSYLAQLLSSLLDCDSNIAYRSIHWPNNINNGDLTVTLPKLRPGVKPDVFAPELMRKFPKDHPLFPLPFVDGVHLRIFLSPEILPRLFLPYILDRKGSFGRNVAPGSHNAVQNSEDGRKKLVLEFSSPNITSEFHGKHLRSTILGAFVGKFHESMGWKVVRVNYLGDWGKPIALLKVGWDRYGNEETFQANPVGHLLEIYHRIESLFLPEIAASRQARDEAAKEGRDEGEAQASIEAQGIYAERNAAFKKLEEGDEDALTFWKRVREANIDNYKDFYSQLGVEFDEYSGESQVKPETMEEIEKLLKEKGIAEDSAGASVIHMQNYGLKAGTAIIRDRTGSSTYLLRELAAVLERSRKFEFDKMIVVAANDNSLHFSYLHHVLKALDLKELADKVQHLKFSEVSKMTDKLGKGYRPQAIIEHCEEAMVAVLKDDEERAAFFSEPVESAKALSVSALLAQELLTRTATTHSFDTAAMTAFKPGSGPDIQYWYLRLNAVLKDHPLKTQLADEDYEPLVEDEPANLLRTLAQYPEVTHATYQSFEPAAIVTYLASVTEQLAECLEEDDEDDTDAGNAQEGASAEEPGDKAGDNLTPGHIALYEATRIVLENGMRVLGLTPYATLEPQRADTPVAE